MLACTTVLTCAMGLFQATRADAIALQEIRDLQGHPGSDEIAWVQKQQNRPAHHIRGPFWTRGVAVHRTGKASVWITPGPAGGVSAGGGIAVDF